MARAAFFLDRGQVAVERHAQRTALISLVFDEEGAAMLAKNLLEHGLASARQRDVLG